MSYKPRLIGESKIYKGVFEYVSRWGNPLFAFVRNDNGAYYPTDRECAIAHDISLIKKGEKPRHILKKK